MNGDRDGIGADPNVLCEGRISPIRRIDREVLFEQIELARFPCSRELLSELKQGLIHDPHSPLFVVGLLRSPSRICQWFEFFFLWQLLPLHESDPPAAFGDSGFFTLVSQEMFQANEKERAKLPTLPI